MHDDTNLTQEHNKKSTITNILILSKCIILHKQYLDSCDVDPHMYTRPYKLSIHNIKCGGGGGGGQ